MTLTIATGKNDTRRTATWKGETAAGNATITRYAPLFSLVCASVQIVGAGAVTLQGSNDGLTYYPLKDLEGEDLTFAGPGYAEFTTGAAFIRPNVTGGGPLDIILTHWAG